MGRQPVRHAALAQRIDARKGGEKPRHAGGIPSRRGAVLDAEPIGFELGLAIVPEKQHAESARADFRKRPRAWNEDAEHGEGQVRLGLAGIGLRGMTRGDVADLVPEHARQLGLVVQVRENSARHVDVAARKRKGVDRGVVDHGERPRQVGPVRRPREIQTDVGDVALQLRVVVDAHLAPNLDVLLLANRELFGLAQQGHLILARHRIGGAGGRQDYARRKKEAGSFSHDPASATRVPELAVTVCGHSGRISTSLSAINRGSTSSGDARLRLEQPDQQGHESGRGRDLADPERKRPPQQLDAEVPHLFPDSGEAFDEILRAKPDVPYAGPFALCMPSSRRASNSHWSSRCNRRTHESRLRPGVL